MALSPTVEATQSDVVVVYEALSAGLLASQSDVVVIFNIPSDEVQAAQADVTFAYKQSSDVQVSQTDVIVIYRGRVEDPKVRAWTFTLDGHEFYVLSLGTRETLVYDVTTGEWFTWGTGLSPTWRAKVGINWTGTGRLPGLFGSNVLIGDDSLGTLYFLDPDTDEDDDAIEGADMRRVFRRRTTAQFLIDSGYAFTPCFGVQAFGSIGQTITSIGGADLGVTLDISDDRGISWTDVGTLFPPDGDYSFRLNWQSLGLMAAPGRLFRMEDYGAVKRLDDFEVELEEGQ